MKSDADKFQKLTSLSTFASLNENKALEAVNKLNVANITTELRHELATQLSNHKSWSVIFALCSVPDIGKEAQTNLAALLVETREKCINYCDDSYLDGIGKWLDSGKFWVNECHNGMQWPTPGYVRNHIDDEASVAIAALLVDEKLCPEALEKIIELQDYSRFVNTDEISLGDLLLNRQDLGTNSLIKFAEPRPAGCIEDRDDFQKIIEHPSFNRGVFEALVKSTVSEAHYNTKKESSSKIEQILDHEFLNDKAMYMIAELDHSCYTSYEKLLPHRLLDFSRNIQSSLKLANMENLPQKAHLSLAQAKHKEAKELPWPYVADFNIDGLDHVSEQTIGNGKIQCHDVAMVISERDDISIDAQEFLANAYIDSNVRDYPQVVTNLAENPGLNSADAIIRLLESEDENIVRKMKDRIDSLLRYMPDDERDSLKYYLDEQKAVYDANAALNSNLDALDI